MARRASFGWLGFVGDFVDDVTRPIGKAANAILQPFGDTITWIVPDDIEELLNDFVKTDFGKVFMFVVTQGATSSLYSSLVPALGAQFASVSFALPGILRGEPFDKAWTTEFVRRVEETVKILVSDYSGEAADTVADGAGEVVGEAAEYAKMAKEYGEELAKQWDQAVRYLNDMLPPGTSVPWTAAELAEKLHVREDMAAYAIALRSRVESEIPKSEDYDYRSGASKGTILKSYVYTTLAQAVAQGTTGTAAEAARKQIIRDAIYKPLSQSSATMSSVKAIPAPAPFIAASAVSAPPDAIAILTPAPWYQSPLAGGGIAVAALGLLAVGIRRVRA